MKHHLYEKSISKIIRCNWSQSEIVDQLYRFVTENPFSLKQQDELIRLLFILNKAYYKNQFNIDKWNKLVEISDQWYEAWYKIINTPGNPILYFGNNPTIKIVSSLIGT